MYIEKRKQAGNFLIVSRYGAPIGVHKGHRAKRHNSTTISVQKYNQKLRSDKVLGYLLCNFEHGLFITLKYTDSKHPASYRDAQECIRKFISNVRLAAKEQGEYFKCIWITERGSKSNRLHHHIVIENNKIIRNIIYRKWENGGVHPTKIGTNWQYKELADYIVKIRGKEERKKNSPIYGTTRNLATPQVIDISLYHKSMQDTPEAPSGYEVLLNSFIHGAIPLLGIPFQKYICIKANNSLIRHLKKPIMTKHSGDWHLPSWPLRFPPSSKHISR